MATKPIPLSSLPGDNRPPTQEGLDGCILRCGAQSAPMTKDKASYLTCVVDDKVKHGYHYGATVDGAGKIKWWKWT